MNKQEAIELLQDMSKDSFENDYTEMVHIDDIVETINKIDETQKVAVPKFVAEWIEYCKQYNLDLQDLLSRLKNGGEMIPERVDMMARAWLDGYEVETEEEIDE